jgi:hypothetical protein
MGIPFLISSIADGMGSVKGRKFFFRRLSVLIQETERDILLTRFSYN